MKSLLVGTARCAVRETTPSRTPQRGVPAIFLALVCFAVSSCVAPDTRHRIVVSIPEQRLALLDNGALVATYPISTSKFAIGDAPGSRGTPLGELEIAKKIGDGAVSGTVFKDRRPTGRSWSPTRRDAIPLSHAFCGCAVWKRKMRTPTAATSISTALRKSGTSGSAPATVASGCVRAM